MNRSIRWVVALASVAGSLSLLPGAVALADAGQSGEHAREHGRHHHGGLVSAALKLDTLSAAQRTQIEQLESARKAAGVPVRQADARVLTDLAHQVEQDHIDRAGLKDGLDAEQAAAQGAMRVDAQTLAQLHGVLTSAQRGALVDGIEGRMPANAPRRAELEAFRGGPFDAAAFVKVHVPGEHAIAMAEKKLPSMSPADRATFAGRLRDRAARQSKG
jgi:Spy/CpxP family protein refolding chaperone